MSRDEKRLGALPFVIGGLSYLPGIGVLFGVTAIAWGLLTRRSGGKKLALIGTGGILFTILLYGSLFYFGFVRRGRVYDRLRARLAQIEMNALVPQIEFYKLQHGRYPTSLEELRQSMPKESAASIIDVACLRLGGKPRPFYYEMAGEDHYYLRSAGADCKPFTADDILPQIDVNSGNKLGLLLGQPPDRAGVRPEK